MYRTYQGPLESVARYVVRADVRNFDDVRHRATFIKDGDPGCSADNWNTKRPYAAGMSSDPATFNPSKLNFSNWLESFRAVGITNAVMTVRCQDSGAMTHAH